MKTIINPDIKSEYLPNIFAKTAFPNKYPPSKKIILTKNVTMLVNTTLNPAILAPKPTPKLFIVRAKPSDTASFGSYTF